MLKKFFLNLLSSFVGTWLALGLFGIVAIIVVTALVAKIGVSQASDTPKVRSNTVLTLDLSGPISEREQTPDLNPVNLIQGNIEMPMTLTSIIEAIREASSDKNVRMIYIKCNGVQAGASTLHAIRDELLEFKKSSKKIYAYGDGMGLGDYYLASVADSLFLNPAGSVSINGMGTMVPYFKGLLDKVGIQMQVVKVGTFKSAVEPYINTEMSGPARAQLDTLYGNMWSFITDEICRSRKLTAERFNTLINDSVLMLQNGDFAERNKIVDKAVYERTMDDRIASALGVKKEKVNFIGTEIMSATSQFGLDYGASRKIAVLFAEGEIREGTKSGINCEVLVPVINKLADDDNVMGLVMRVNSPGGSVFGSDQIGEALNYFKSKGKPFAVSMGDYAASGGYWISCQADRIFADPLTVTGSIGIFGMIPNAERLAQNIGVNPQQVSTNPDVDFPSLLKPMTEPQLASMQKMVERGYDQFVGRVASGRKLSEKRVRVIAEGRVWDGQKALTLKLVDQLGGMQAAIDWVQKKIDEGKDKGKPCKVAFYPELDNNFWSLIQLSMQNELRLTLIREAVKLAPEVSYAEEMELILSRRAIQARMMPFKTIL